MQAEGEGEEEEEGEELMLDARGQAVTFSLADELMAVDPGVFVPARAEVDMLQKEKEQWEEERERMDRDRERMRKEKDEMER